MSNMMPGTFGDDDQEHQGLTECPVCGGEGIIHDDDNDHDCSECDGTGRVYVSDVTPEPDDYL
jgi:DnaJ-class molecular chaperone